MSIDKEIQLDNYDKTVKKDDKNSRNSIKMREGSYINSSRYYGEYLDNLNDELNKIFEESEKELSQMYNEEKSETEIEKTGMDYALRIAELEKNINVLSRVQGPVESINSRAIRLKDEMIKNARNSSRGIYSVLDSNASDNFDLNDSSIDNDNFIDVEKISQENQAVASSSVDNAIDSTEEEFTQNDYDETQNALEEVVNGEADKVSFEDNSNENFETTTTDIENSNQEDNSYESAVEKVNDAEIKESQVVTDEIQPEEYNEDMIAKEEGTGLRDNVEVVPERYESYVEDNKIEANEYSDSEPMEEFTTKVESSDIHFDYSDATINDINKAVDSVNSIQDLEEIRIRYQQLKKEEKESEEDLDNAKKEQHTENEKVQEYERNAQDKQKEYQDYLNKINESFNSIEDIINNNKETAKNVRKETEVSRSYILKKEAEIKDYDSKINELRSMMNEDTKESDEVINKTI